MWDILGLDGPTDDVRAIKKAYAKTLRVTRPDDDPIAFMALRDALEQAKLYAAYAHDGDDVFTAMISMADGVSVVPELEPLPACAVNEDASDISKPVQETAKDSVHKPAQMSPVQDLISNVEALLKEPFARADKDQWRKIFDDERLDPIDNMIDFEDMLRNTLLDQFGYFDGDMKKSNQKRNPSLIPSRIGTLIFNMMGWREIHGRPLYVQDQIE